MTTADLRGGLRIRRPAEPWLRDWDSHREIETGWVTEFIRFPWADPRDTAGNGAEFVTVDAQGNMYGGEPRPRQLRKYIRVRP